MLKLIKLYKFIYQLQFLLQITYSLMHSFLKRKRINQFKEMEATSIAAIIRYKEDRPLKLMFKDKKASHQRYLEFINQKQALKEQKQNFKINKKIKLPKQSFSQLIVTTKKSDIQKFKNMSQHFVKTNRVEQRYLKGRKFTKHSTNKSVFQCDSQPNNMSKTFRQTSNYSCSDIKYYLNPDLSKTNSWTTFRQSNWHSEHNSLQKQNTYRKKLLQINQKINYPGYRNENFDFNVIGSKPLWRNFESYSPSLRNSHKFQD